MSLRSTVHETDDLFAAQELFHARGWTDGLPVVPPTEAAVRACLKGAAPPPDHLIGNEWTTDPEEILETFAAEIRANMRQYSIWPGHYAVIVPRQLRDHLVAAGFTRTDACRRLQERARIRRREWADVGKARVVRDRGDTEYRALPDPEHLLLVAAGGPAGGFGAVIPPWFGEKSRAVTLPVGACVDCGPPSAG